MRVKTNTESMAKLQQELRDAGLDFQRIGIIGTAEDGELVIFDGNGNPSQALLDDPRTKAVVDAHRPDPPSPEPDFGSDAPSPDFKKTAAATVQAMRAYLANQSPTAPQTVAVVKLLIRTMLFIVKFLVNPSMPPPPPPAPTPFFMLPEQLPGADIAAEIQAERDAEQRALDEQAMQMAQGETIETYRALALLIEIRQAAAALGITDADIATSIIGAASRAKVETETATAPD